MNFEGINDLIDIMKVNNIKLLEIERGGERYKLELFLQNQNRNSDVTDGNKQTEVIIKAPIAGIVHYKPQSKENDSINKNFVSKGEVLCAIEVMKSYQEIIAEFDMNLIEILFKKGQIVEYGQPLFRVKRMV